ncbi:uncharacterized protein LOC129766501 [Toxorhynchites rutilus septentrionalis]|uniref:uncharacterized protein LOC129766501 n=1 Tax=Toxorhynchites rutilus septentrionalis TaxID=329112 RepID=UPI0024790D9C|nr:uncharacterized protein LOC129766501 [Toxorhynchites rutilus septentrionalis]
MFILFTVESKFRKMQRVTASILRFINHIRPNGQRQHRYGPLLIEELAQATLALASFVQKEAFPVNFHHLSVGQELHRKSKLIPFKVFLDTSRFTVPRIGGRICQAALPVCQKHPIVLTSDHPFTHALIRSYHEDRYELMHAPPQMFLSALRRRFWVLNGRSVVRKIIRRCVICFRAKSVLMQQKMDGLPRSRLEGVYPFLNTGVDFCGPMYIRQHSKRSFLHHKQGAIPIPKDEARRDDWCEKSAIEWHLIPPRSPHFGGLWEAGVRSTKYHLKRITGTANMNLEQYTTVLTRIEAILNSRPTYI